MLRLQLSKEEKGVRQRKRIEKLKKKKKVVRRKLRQVSCWNIAKPAPADCQHHQDSIITENKCMASAEHTHFLPFNSFFSSTLKALAIDFRFIVLNIVSKVANIIYGKKKKIPWRREWQPTPYSCLENPKDKGA